MWEEAVSSETLRGWESGEQKLERERKVHVCFSTIPPTLPPASPPPLGLEVLVRERGQGRDTGCQAGGAGHRVGIAEPSILAFLKVDAARGEDGGVLIKEVIGSEQEANFVPHSDCVGDVLSMGDVQEAGCNPGHQVLKEEGGAEGL